MAQTAAVFFLSHVNAAYEYNLPSYVLQRNTGEQKSALSTAPERIKHQTLLDVSIHRPTLSSLRVQKTRCRQQEVHRRRIVASRFQDVGVGGPSVARVGTKRAHIDRSEYAQARQAGRQAGGLIFRYFSWVQQCELIARGTLAHVYFHCFDVCIVLYPHYCTAVEKGSRLQTAVVCKTDILPTSGNRWQRATKHFQRKVSCLCTADGKPHRNRPDVHRTTSCSSRLS